MGRQHALGRAGSALNRKNREARKLAKAKEVLQSQAEEQGTSLEEMDLSEIGPVSAHPVESPVAATFSNIVNEIRTQIRGEGSRPAHNAAVDIKLVFRSLDLRSKGLIFKREQKESSVSLELATRILPDEE